MPMPKRRKGEAEQSFISRFMGDPKMREEYPDEEQRLAVAVSQARKSAHKDQRKAASYKLPDSARNNARKVLRWKDEHGDAVKGMTEVGWRRARQLAENATVGADTVKRMAQFNRHRKNAKVDPKFKGEPWRDAGHVAWLGWGGTSGIEWAIRTSESIDKSATIFDAIAEAREVLADAYIAKSSGPDLDALRDLVRGDEMNIEKLNMLTQWNGAIGAWSANILKNLTDLQSEVLDANLPIVKVSEEQRLVYAWASVIEKGGEPVVDLHGDIIEEGELVKAAHRSLRRIVGKQMHQGGAVAEVVESFVMTKEVQKMLDIDLGQVGWLVAMKVHDESVWNKIKGGELAALSIGGRGLKTEQSDV